MQQNAFVNVAQTACALCNARCVCTALLNYAPEHPLLARAQLQRIEQRAADTEEKRRIAFRFEADFLVRSTSTAARTCQQAFGTYAFLVHAHRRAFLFRPAMAYFFSQIFFVLVTRRSRLNHLLKDSPTNAPDHRCFLRFFLTVLTGRHSDSNSEEKMATICC